MPNANIDFDLFTTFRIGPPKKGKELPISALVFDP